MTLDADTLYLLRTVDGRVLEAADFGLPRGAAVRTGRYGEELSQLWELRHQPDGGCKIQNAAAGRFLEASGTRLITGSGEEAAAPVWRLETAEEGVRIFSAYSGQQLTVDADGGEVLLRVEGTVWTPVPLHRRPSSLPRLLPVEGAVEHSSTPEIIRYGNTYYSYIMAPGVAIKSSTDLLHWETVGSAFPAPPQLPFAWMEREVPGGGIWAPGVYQIGDRYYLYYCISTGGSQNSAIGVAVNTTLDHTSPDFKWEDKGMVIRSHTGDPYNCIDPNVILDGEGLPWLVFGSYWDGVHMCRLDPATGLLDEAAPSLYPLASRRNTPSTAIEAPFMIKHGEYYYLFAAFERMDENYHCGVGRSPCMTGPFIDKSGKPMLEGGGTAVTEAKEGIEIPGHASVFRDDNGRYYLVSEYFRRGSPSLLLIGSLVWDKDGWPVTALTPALLSRDLSDSQTNDGKEECKA